MTNTKVYLARLPTPSEVNMRILLLVGDLEVSAPLPRDLTIINLMVMWLHLRRIRIRTSLDIVSRMSMLIGGALTNCVSSFMS